MPASGAWASPSDLPVNAAGTDAVAQENCAGVLGGLGHCHG